MARSHPVYLETMQITLSFATTADGYLDDNSPRRLMISTPEDWEAVLRLRASHDAILAGAETLRRDDPALLLRDAAARELRRARGMRPDLTKVTLTHSGRLSPSMRFFTEGDADRYVFSEKELPELPEEGLLNLFIQHTSAGLTINENADPSVRTDFERSFNHLIPENQSYYTHVLEGSDDMPAHLKSSVIGVSLTVPIRNKKLALGTWQGIYLCEFRDYGGPRKLIATIWY